MQWLWDFAGFHVSRSFIAGSCCGGRDYLPAPLPPLQLNRLQQYASCADIEVVSGVRKDAGVPTLPPPPSPPLPTPNGPTEPPQIKRRVLLLNSNTACASTWSDMRVCEADDAACTVMASSLLYVDPRAGEAGCGLGGFGCPGKVLNEMARANKGKPSIECKHTRVTLALPPIYTCWIPRIVRACVRPRV